MPGVRQAGLAVIVAGLACWFLALPQLAKPVQQVAMAETGELAEVAADDVLAALGTMDGSPTVLARLKQRSCDQRLAWVSVARPPGGTPGTVRLRSGSYFSPVFTPTEVPMRVAIPYPAPYATGRGTLSVLTAGGEAAVALTPVWTVPTGASGANRTVTWHLDQSCARPNG